MAETVYLDHNATTPVSAAALEAMMPYLGAEGFNPSSPYRAAQRVRTAMDHARRGVAGLLSCEPEEVVFTSGATESCNLAILGAIPPDPVPHAITVVAEHSAVLGPFRELERRGAAVTKLAVDRSGRIDLALLESSMRPETRQVSVMLSNNETGVIHDVRAVGRLCRSRGVLFHCDATAAVGKMPVHPHDISCDLLSLSGHKFHAPKGVGALFVRRGVKLSPVLFGGGQEEGLRAGTENVPGIVGLGAAARESQTFLSSGGPARLEKLRDDLERRVCLEMPFVEVVGAGVPRVCNTSCLRVAGIQNDELVLSLDREGVQVSTGSACATGAPQPSHVIMAMGYSAAEAREVIRVSMGSGTTDSDVARFVVSLSRAATRLRAAA